MKLFNDASWICRSYASFLHQSDLICALCFQLAISSRKHPLAAAPLCYAESSHPGVFGSGEGGPACPGALFGRVGPHSPDCSPRQDLIRPLLQDFRGESLHTFERSI